MKLTCPKCGHEHDINPAQMLGGIRTAKKEAAWKANGERLKKMYANARKVESTPIPRITMSREDMQAAQMDSRFIDEVAPKPGTLAEKKASALAALASVTRGSPDFVRRELEKGSERYDDLQNTPTAPFDFNDEEGNPHRVRAYGKFLKVCFLRDGVEEPLRNLAEGELERLWAKRIIK